MRNFFVMLLVGMMSFGLAVEYAEARRMGGGGNIGMTRSAPAAPAQQQAQRNAQQQQGQQAARPGMGGMLGGLLAGGLLAALFFGGAFDGIQFMDILIIALLAFLLFRLFARRRAAVAGGPAQTAQHEPQQAQPQAFHSDAQFGGAGMAPLPEWFDKERFLGGAKEHFMTLQRAWDNHDLSAIQEYVTPELYNQLREERAKHPANNRTEVVTLLAELGDVREVGQKAEASVIFHGILNENGEQNEFNETWYLTRDLREGAPWYIEGIGQNPQ